MNAVVTVYDILKFIDKWAPFSSAEEWDNVGLLVGCPDTPVSRVVVALDISRQVIAQANESGAQLIISHHPVIFSPVKKLEPDSPAHLLARHNIASIAAHTNLDKAPGGVSDTLTAKLGLKNISVSDDRLCRIGTTESEMQPKMFAEYVGRMLGVGQGGIMWSGGNHLIRTVAVCGGAGGDSINDVLPLADAFVTGELHYHEWPLDISKTVVAAGHYHTEIFAMHALKSRLETAFDRLSVTLAQTGCPYTTL